MVFALVVGAAAVFVLDRILKPEALKRVAYLNVDGSDIRFANPEYQRMYTGESRRGKKDEVDWRQVHWR